MSTVLIVNYDNTSTDNIKKILDKINKKYTVVKPTTKINLGHYSHAILSGSRQHVYEEGHDKIPHTLVVGKTKILGICYGMQLIAELHGMKVSRLKKKQHGKFEIAGKIVWMNRKDGIFSCSEGFEILETFGTTIVKFTDNVKYWGVQYHPENPKCRNHQTFVDFLLK